ncbi:GDSL-type esterase/lipase family protein [Cytobacillus praedii]|uniref:GDSL-type esterase/lipase family protein n=1 Tax=Cytobacillus praedii TaxID=1742358 RepID=UPI002E220C81|nr:GDSL-type esterase/lipase family protein [Cytobacillus praedii]
MKKKVFLSVLIGVLVLFAAACGNNQNDKQTVPIDSKSTYKSVYSKSVFLGDSLLIGLEDVLEDSNVISNAGATALFALNEVDKIASEKPENVFILLGSDDLLWPVDNPIEDSLINYTKLIEEIKGKLPKTKVHVLSVTPVTKEAMKVEPRYKNIADYNKALEKMAVREKVNFIDLSPIFEKHQNLYNKDGIHFTANFYPLLLDHIEKYIDSSTNNGEVSNEL